MANSGKRDEELYDRMDRFDVGDLDDSLADESATSSRTSGDGRLSENGIGLMERLTDVLVERGDGDLLMQQSNHEDMLLQWLQALDMQVIGACRADERLAPLLKLNAPGGAADDRLLAYLSQHFEPSEVGMLARCFCMPLVSIRVGKIEKQGTLLFPTSARGNLNLILLPTSDLRLSFVGDDGQTERIYTLLSHGIDSSLVEVEEMSEDASGRSFLVKIPDGREFFFWCSEKSKLLGDELLRKMRDLLKKRPSVADLTGINESRLSCFATSVRTYLAGPSLTSVRASVSGSPPIISSSTSNCHNNARENYPSAANLPLPQQTVTESSSSSLTVTAADNLPDAAMMETALNSDLLHRSSAEEPKSSCEISLDFLESLSEITMPPSFRPICLNQQPVLSPYYCWCPPSHPSNESIFSPSPPHQSLSLSDLPTTLDFPTNFLPDPFPNMVNSHQNIPTFTPIMCDLPIVHIPVIDVGQGYLVTAGATIPPLHPKLVNHHHRPLIPEPNSSALEEGARETLRLLLGGSSALAMASASPGGENMELSGGTRDATAVGIGLISLPWIPGLDGDNTAGAEGNDDDDEA